MKKLLFFTLTGFCLVVNTVAQPLSEITSPGENTVTDVDGNVYKTVRIGKQTWMAENLRTSRSYDGTQILKVTKNTAWDHPNVGAFCWYNDDSTGYENLYGKLYNWYEINTDKLCPYGWRVPWTGEWQILINNLDEATFASEFLPLPGGSLVSGGSYVNAGIWGYFWTKSDYFDNQNYKWNIAISPSGRSSFSGSQIKSYNSVRCINDTSKIIAEFLKLTTDTIIFITRSSAESGGHINYQGGIPITAKGICWNTSPNPDTTNWRTFDGSGSGSYISTLTGLNPNTTYYVRAYAINSTGIVYGNELVFNTLDYDPVDLQRGLVAYYPFNGNATDESRNNYDGTVDGALLTSDRFEKKRSAYLFNGTGDCIVAKEKFFNTGWDEYSVSCWIYSTSENKPGSNTENQAIISTSAGNCFGLCFNWGGNNKYGIFLNSDPSKPTWDILQNGVSKTGTSINRWNHLVFVKKNNLYSLYINGCLDTTYLSSISSSDYISYIILGGITLSEGKEYFKGKLDDYRIYNRALNILEINALCKYGGYSLKTPSVITDPAYSISKFTAVAKGIILNDEDAPIVERGICWSENSSPDTTDYRTISVSGSDTFVCNIAGLKPNTLYYAKAYVINSEAVGYGMEIQFRTLPDRDFGTVTDIDGNVYRTVWIGSNNWMAENLKVTSYNDGSPIPNVTDNLAWGSQTEGAYCWYNNDEETYKDKNGALYNYYAVADSRKLCPVDWHVATGYEWFLLPTTVLHHPGQLYYNPTALIETGFNPLLTGARQGLKFGNQPYGAFRFIDFCALFWKIDRRYFIITVAPETALGDFQFTYTLLNGYTVRCVEDKPSVHFSNLNTLVNEYFEVPVSIHNLPDGKIISYQFDFLFDSDKMIYQGTSLDNTISTGGEVQVNQVGGKLSLAWAGQSALPDSGLLVKLKFKAIEVDTLYPAILNFLINTDTIHSVSSGTISIYPAYGDIDCNESIQAYDAALALQYSVGLDPLPDIDPLPWENWRIVVANVDGTNGVSAYDASLILQFTVGIINSFPVQGYLERAVASQADVTVSIENGNIVFRSSGNLMGVNVHMNENSEMFGLPNTALAGSLLASNYNPDNLSVGLAMANSPAENEIVLTIPVVGISEKSVVLNLLINNREKQINLGTITGISEDLPKTIEMFPNPAHTMLYFKNLPKDATISIFDLNGRKVRSILPAAEQIDISDLASGLYSIQIEIDGRLLNRKFVKQ